MHRNFIRNTVNSLDPFSNVWSHTVCSCTMLCDWIWEKQSYKFNIPTCKVWPNIILHEFLNWRSSYMWLLCIKAQTCSWSFVHDNYYYCKYGTMIYTDGFHVDDLVWDGEGCSSNNNCCSEPSMPWLGMSLFCFLSDLFIFLSDLFIFPAILFS